MSNRDTLTYFSIDYRSPPSGLGQIVFPGGSNKPSDLVLVTYKGNGDVANPFYKVTQHFPKDLFEEGGREWLAEKLLGYGVTHVYDTELGDQWGMSQHLGEHYYPIAIWFNRTFGAL